MATDLITPVIVASFGGVILLVVLGFFLVRQRSGRVRFERDDYYKTYRKPSSGFSERRSPFKEDPMAAQARNERRTLALIIIGVTAVSIAIAIIFNDLIEVLLVLIFLPVIVRFVRARNEARRRTSQDESHSY